MRFVPSCEMWLPINEDRPQVAYQDSDQEHESIFFLSLEHQSTSLSEIIAQLSQA